MELVNSVILCYFAGFLYFWGIVFFISTTLVALLKKENPPRGRQSDAEPDLSIAQTYKLLVNIVKLPSIRTTAIILLTSKVSHILLFTEKTCKQSSVSVLCSSIKKCVMFLNKDDFYSVRLLTSLQTPKLEDTPGRLSTTAYSIYLQLTFISGGLLPYPQPEGMRYAVVFLAYTFYESVFFYACS